MFLGVCRMHRLQLLQISGQWAQAEAEASVACAELAELNVERRRRGALPAGRALPAARRPRGGRGRVSPSRRAGARSPARSGPAPARPGPGRPGRRRPRHRPRGESYRAVPAGTAAAGARGGRPGQRRPGGRRPDERGARDDRRPVPHAGLHRLVPARTRCASPWPKDARRRPCPTWRPPWPRTTGWTRPTRRPAYGCCWRRPTDLLGETDAAQAERSAPSRASIGSVPGCSSGCSHGAARRHRGRPG